MPDFPPLAELQSLFWRLVAAPEGVVPGAAELCREGALASEDLSFLVPPDDRMASNERLDVYADMYFYRLRDCLAEDFPKLEARLGPARWHNLVTDYVLAHPPSHFSLRELGRALPGFLRDHPLTPSDPVLCHLARLEWARVDVFDERDAEPLSRDALLERGGAAPDRVRFALVPAARLLLDLDPAALVAWRHLDADAEPDDAEPTDAPRPACDAIAWRRGFAVYHRSLAPDEARCLRALGEGGATLGELGERLLEGTASADTDFAARFAALLEAWSREGLLVEVSPRPS